ncbi:MAG: deoxyribose-phosphate aldolase [Bacteroidales bacterium]|nr:deoxyribose-phosphate aldolase [Bacteroidales bacterium]
MSDMMLARRLFACIDNTTLNATDNDATVEAFCRRTRELTLDDGTHVAAVCVYPRFVDVARRTLEGSGIRVASVAGAFPHGQLPTGLKVKEVRYAVAQGADEVDVVLSRGLLLAGEDNAVRDEVAALKEACGTSRLKVILETGELPSPTLVERASQLAIDGGADFIKTSTGKIAVGATLDAAESMLNVVKRNVKKYKKTIGFKAAGGISTPEEAVAYAEKAKKIMGEDYINNQTFRIGASRLTECLHAFLTFQSAAN